MLKDTGAEQVTREQAAELEQRMQTIQVSLSRANAQIPTKLVCAGCKEDANKANHKLYCEKCDAFHDGPVSLGFMREDNTDLVLTPEQHAQLEKHRLQRGIYYAGIAPAGFVFLEEHVNSSFGLVPKGASPMAQLFAESVHVLQRGILVYYCSADEQKNVTLKNEWCAVIRAKVKDDKISLTLSTLNARPETKVHWRDRCQRSNLLSKMIMLLLSNELSAADIDSMTLRPPAREYLAQLKADPNATINIVHGPGEGSTEFGQLADELLAEMQQSEETADAARM